MNNLARIEHGHIVTDTLIIAEGVKLDHPSIMKMVKKYEPEINELGLSRFEIRKESRGGRPQEFAILDEQQTTFLITLLRNSVTVVKFKQRLTKEFYAQRDYLYKIQHEPSRAQAIIEKREVASILTDSLVFKRTLEGKNTTANHFSNEHLFCNRALTGNWEKLDESLLSVYDLKLLKAIRSHNALLLQHDLKQSDRRQKLDDFVTEYRVKNKQLILEQNK